VARLGFLSFLVRKAISRVAIFFIVITFVFIIPRLLPGGAFAYLIENPNVSPETRDTLVKIFGLDRPLWEQYVAFMKELLTKGNLGISFRYLKPVSSIIVEALPWTLLLVGSAMVLSSIMGVILGALAAYYRGKRTDSIVVNTLMTMRSMPSFWLGMVLLLVLGFHLRWFPLYGAYTYGKEQGILEAVGDILRHLTLPLLTLSLIELSTYTMIMRSTTLDILGEDFILTAKAKGLPEREILFKHAVRPGILPVITILSINIGSIIGGAMITETVFSYPGTGKLLYDSVFMSDYPLTLGIFSYITIVTLVATFVAEVLYGRLDPRVRVG